MLLIIQIIVCLSVLLLLQTYVVYPLLLRFLAKSKDNNNLVYTNEEDWPEVSVIMSLYNEEQVIKDKMESLQALNYPTNKIQFYIGSDCSSDGTNQIVNSYKATLNGLHFFPFTDRRGKPGVINELVSTLIKTKPLSQDHIFLLTDASVIISPGCIKHLMKHFKNEKIVLVDSNMTHVGMKSEGISKSEDDYISSEVRIKHNEGKLWGKMIGPFGGCFAIRSNFFEFVPPNYLVDDFFIAMKVFEKGGLAINDLEAVCYEGVSHDMKEEYRRKARISAGNFQNLKTFRKLWWPPLNQLNFAFFSHKVLRWFGPFFIIFALIGSAFLAWKGLFIYKLLFALIVFLMMVLPLLDSILKMLNVNWKPLRTVRYFLFMNLALLEGFIKYLKGINTNVWQPPKRN